MAHNLPASQEKHNTFSYIIICEALDETTEQGDTEQGETTPEAIRTLSSGTEAQS